MNKEIAMQWADALESGKYEQTMGNLHDPGGFCCLGVLCDIHAHQHSGIGWQGIFKSVYMDETHVLPKGVREWSGIERANGGVRSRAGIIVGGHSFSHLADANDSGMHFPEIAKWIRENYEQL